MRARRLAIRSAVLSVMCAALLTSCGGDEPYGDDTVEPLAAPGAGQGVQLRIDARFAAGTEDTVCRFFVVPEGGLHVARFEHALPERAHHLLLFPTDLTPATAEPFLGRTLHHCETDQENRSFLRGVYYGGQPGRGAVEYPQDTALRLEGGEVVMLEFHVVNTTPEEYEGELRLNLWGSAQPVARSAGTLHFYDWAIDVPPQSSAEARMRCRLPEDVTLMFGHGHMHERGERFQAWVGNSEQPILDTDAWDDATTAFAPSVRVAAGEPIEFACSYRNDTSRRFQQGLSAQDDEMCSLTLGYVTDHGQRLTLTDEACGHPGSGLIGSGEFTCGQLEQCIDEAVQSATDIPSLDRASQRCWVNACGDVGIAFRDFAACRLKCLLPCQLAPETGGFVARAGSSPACSSCVAQHCAAEQASCEDGCKRR